MRFLLLQARFPDDPMRPQECLCFRETLGLGPDELVAHDILGGRPSEERLQAVDCVLVGGSGDFGVGDTERYPWLIDFIDYMGALVEQGFPTFASCFGFQALVVAGGGVVEEDKGRSEVGTFKLSVTDEGRRDPLFAPLAPEFYGQVGHKDHATRLPGGVLHLAGSERSPYQAFTIPGKRIYATQFHPELTMQRNLERFRSYEDRYTGGGMVDSAETVLSTFRETAEASRLIPAYVREILPPHSAAEC